MIADPWAGSAIWFVIMYYFSTLIKRRISSSECTFDTSAEATRIGHQASARSRMAPSPSLRTSETLTANQPSLFSQTKTASLQTAQPDSWRSARRILPGGSGREIEKVLVRKNQLMSISRHKRPLDEKCSLTLQWRHRLKLRMRYSPPLEQLASPGEVV